MTTRRTEGMHFGRSYTGHPLEDDCPCIKAACGLVDEPNDDCPQHAPGAAKTMRQFHWASECASGVGR